MTTTLDHRPFRSLPRHAPPGVRRPPAPGAPSSPTTPVRQEDRAPGWERNGDRRDRLGLALSELFSTRNDLGGVSVVADVLAEDLLWSV
jgi:hypothetical protein